MELHEFMSCSGMPARSAMAMPSPVLIMALVLVAVHARRPRGMSGSGLDDQRFAGLDLQHQCAEHITSLSRSKSMAKIRRKMVRA